MPVADFQRQVVTHTKRTGIKIADLFFGSAIFFAEFHRRHAHFFSENLIKRIGVLYYAVGHWNAYFDAIIYLNDRKLFPLQIFLREVLILNSIELETLYDEEMMEARQGLADLLKYSLIVVSVAPMLILYPFVQKFFIKGVMIGSLKG